MHFGILLLGQLLFLTDLVVSQQAVQQMLHECPAILRNSKHNVPGHHLVHKAKNAMSLDERGLFIKYLSEAKVYYEFGSGGSTSMACTFDSMEKLISVEADHKFFNAVIEGTECLHNNSKFIAEYVDIGPVKEWSYPVGNQPLWHLYPDTIYKYKDYRPDLVLIDGRFRVACFLTTLLALEDSLTNVTILLHDFFIRVKEYGAVLKFATVVACVDTLIVLKPILPLDKEGIKKSLEEYVKIPNRKLRS